jgi:hypothetical protein
MLLLSAGVAAQTSDQASLARLTRELRRAIQDDTFNSAVEIATRLDDAVDAKHRAWLVRDSRERVEEVLAWLPRETESFWVNQEPFVINREESVYLLSGRPTQAYSLDRLMALNDGRYYSLLTNQTVRLVVAATRSMRGPQFDMVAVPGAMPPQDVVYFYFFKDPIDLPPPDESVQEWPVWRASARIDAGGVFRPGVERAQRDDTNWISLARPDLLILVNRKELLSEILSRIEGGSKTRALPSALPEWSQVDRNAPFWGLRHYTTGSKPKAGARGCDAAELPQPDCAAVGVTVRFDTVHQLLEIRYLSETKLAQQQGPFDYVRREFQVDQPQTGVWRLVSDVQARGPSPVHFALIMLGFGVYR